MVNSILSAFRRRLAFRHVRAAEERTICEALSWITAELAERGYRSDFSLESLNDLDLYLDTQCEDGRPKPGTLLSEHANTGMLALGLYIGEVVRRARGGEWYLPRARPGDIFQWEFRFGTGVRMWPVQRVFKRICNGIEDSLSHYGQAAMSV
jgi:hypothetical protein